MYETRQTTPRMEQKDITPEIYIATYRHRPMFEGKTMKFDYTDKNSNYVKRDRNAKKARREKRCIDKDLVEHLHLLEYESPNRKYAIKSARKSGQKIFYEDVAKYLIENPDKSQGEAAKDFGVTILTMSALLKSIKKNLETPYARQKYIDRISMEGYIRPDAVSAATGGKS